MFAQKCADCYDYNLCVVLKCYVLLGLRYWTDRVIYAKCLTVKLKVIPLKLFYYQTFFETWPG